MAQTDPASQVNGSFQRGAKISLLAKFLPQLPAEDFGEPTLLGFGGADGGG